jgi:hypothetical protein
MPPASLPSVDPLSSAFTQWQLKLPGESRGNEDRLSFFVVVDLVLDQMNLFLDQPRGVEPRMWGEKCPPRMKLRANFYRFTFGRFYFAIEPKKRFEKFQDFT